MQELEKPAEPEPEPPKPQVHQTTLHEQIERAEADEIPAGAGDDLPF